MTAIGGILLALSIVGLIYGFIQKRKAGVIANVPFVSTADAAAGKGAGDKGAISTYGAVNVTTPLLSPCTQTPCLYYELKVEGFWKEGDSNKSKDYVKEEVAAVFTVNDGSGDVAVDARKGVSSDELKESFKKEQKEGLFDDIKKAVGKGKAMEFGSYGFENPIGSKADRFVCTEKVIPVTSHQYVAGKAAQGVITQSDGMFGSLILSAKTRDELLGATTASAQKAIKFSGIGAGVGLVLWIIGSLMGGGKPAPAPTPAAPPAGEMAPPPAPPVDAAPPADPNAAPPADPNAPPPAPPQ